MLDTCLVWKALLHKIITTFVTMREMHIHGHRTTVDMFSAAEKITDCS